METKLKENYTYPVLLKKQNDDSFIIKFPDFPNQLAEADSIDEAVENAQNIIALCLVDIEVDSDPDRLPPEPSPLDDIPCGENDVVVYVNLWMPYFRKLTKEIYVKKTLTVPSYLDVLAKQQNVNFSAILVEGLKAKLGLPDRDIKKKKF